jgi:hypothetical protein
MSEPKPFDTPNYSLTPTGNPLSDEQIEEWRRFLLNEVGVHFGHSSPVGANVLCDMAKAALRLVASETEREITSAMEDAGMAEAKYQYNLPVTRASVVAIFRAMEKARG